MADKKRVFKLAEEIKIEALEIIAYLKSEGVEGISAGSHIDAERVQDIRDHFSGKKAKSKKSAKAETKSVEKTPGKKSKTEDKAETLEAVVAKQVEVLPPQKDLNVAEPLISPLWTLW